MKIGFMAIIESVELSLTTAAINIKIPDATGSRLP